MLLKIINNVEYQSFPIVDNMIDIDDNLIEQIGITKQFDVINQCVIPYDNSSKVKEKEIQSKIIEYKKILDKLSEDIIQYMYGEEVPNINERKKEFIEIHNKLRELEGKPQRTISRS